MNLTSPAKLLLSDPIGMHKLAGAIAKSTTRLSVVHQHSVYRQAESNPRLGSAIHSCLTTCFPWVAGAGAADHHERARLHRRRQDRQRQDARFRAANAAPHQGPAAPRPGARLSDRERRERPRPMYGCRSSCSISHFTARKQKQYWCCPPWARRARFHLPSSGGSLERFQRSPSA